MLVNRHLSKELLTGKVFLASLPLFLEDLLARPLSKERQGGELLDRAVRGCRMLSC